MARGKKKDTSQTAEERLEQTFVPVEEQPYTLPINWRWVRWGSCGDFIAGSGFKNEFQGFTEFSIPFYKVGSLKFSDFEGYLFDNTNTVSEEMRVALKAALIPENSVLFAKIGEAIRLNRRSLNRVPCCIDNNMMAFVPNNYVLYLYSFFWSKGIELYDYTNATTVPAIRKSDLENIPFPLPPLAEQQRIVDRIESLFAKLDEAKERAQAVVDGFETRKAAILHKAFTGELIGQHNTDIVALTAIADEICIGPFGSSLHKEDYVIGGTPVINPKHIVEQKINPEEATTIAGAKAEELARYRLKENDIILGRRGDMGRSAPITKQEDGWFCGTGSMIIRLKPEFLAPLYSLFIASYSSIQYLEENCVGTTLKNLNEKIVSNMPIPQYSLSIQRELLSILDTILIKEQQAKEAAEAVLDRIETMKKSILARAFRGELGTNDPSEESAVRLLMHVV